MVPLTVKQSSRIMMIRKKSNYTLIESTYHYLPFLLTLLFTFSTHYITHCNTVMWHDFVNNVPRFSLHCLASLWFCPLPSSFSSSPSFTLPHSLSPPNLILILLWHSLSLSRSLRKFAIEKLPNPLEFFGYVYCFTCLLAGPGKEGRETVWVLVCICLYQSVYSFRRPHRIYIYIIV